MSVKGQSFSLANQDFAELFSQVEVTGDFSGASSASPLFSSSDSSQDMSRQDVSLVPMSPSQYRPYTPQEQTGSSLHRSQFSSGFQNAAQTSSASTSILFACMSSYPR